MKEATKPIFDQQASVAKLIFLAAMSVALCSLGLTMPFAPIPLVIAFLLYGRLMTFAVAIAANALMIVAALVFKVFPLDVSLAYIMAIVSAFLVSMVIFKNIEPVKGLIRAGIVLVLLFTAGLAAIEVSSPKKLKGEIESLVTMFVAEVKKGNANAKLTSEQEKAVDEVIGKPEVLTETFYQMIPFAVVASSFFGLWISLYVTLRNSLVWRYKVGYDYGLAHLVHFKVPFVFVYPLILSMILFIGVDYGLPAVAGVVGKNLLFSLGVFYLFQGFGVYSDFLKFLKIRGFFKTIFMAFTFIFAYNFLAIVGLFDLWFDFRKFFKNKKNEGDTI